MTRLRVRNGKIEKLTPKRLENYERKILTRLFEEQKDKRHVYWATNAHYAGSTVDRFVKYAHKLTGLAMGMYYRWF